MKEDELILVRVFRTLSDEDQRFFERLSEMPNVPHVPEASPQSFTLFSLVERWCEIHQMDVKHLLQQSDVPCSVLTQMKEGTLLDPKNVRKLAVTMNIPSVFLVLSGASLGHEELPLTPDLSDAERSMVNRYRTHTIRGKAILQGALDGIARWPHLELSDH